MITAHLLTKRFGAKTAVDHVSFEVPEGRVTGFLGPNGAGKSTTIRMILGLDTPTAGEALINGRPYRSLRRPLHEVGALLDAGAAHSGRTARQHLRCLAASNGISGRRVGEVMKLTGIEHAAGIRIGRYSLGMRQRLGLAVALLGDPPILILDEPTNGLDPEGIRWIRLLMMSMAAEGRTVLMSSHLISEVSLIAGHLLVLGAGRLIADTDTAQLIARSGLPSLEDAYLKLTDDAVEYRSSAAGGLS